MKVLVTGHEGYIGCVLVPLFQEAGHEVVGLDNGLFQGCEFDDPATDCETVQLDIRDVEPSDVAGFDAVVHLAGISNDPLGDLNPRGTYDINHEASVRLAQAAKAAGVPRFLHSSSCSLYGAAGDAPIDETADFNPVTPYGESKVFVERDVTPMADDTFSPAFLRNSTAYGVSPRLRGDLVVNNLTGYAFTTGDVLLKSDGTPWRPLVHIRDISRAFLTMLEAPREKIHGKAFNVGSTKENYRMREVADIVASVVPNSSVTIAEGAGPDKRCYRVNCDLITKELGFECEWTVKKGVEELYAAYKDHGLTLDEFESGRYLRIRHVRSLIESGALGTDLRFTGTNAA
ncbi:MAG: SDR family oxidoreductase [Planctomycetota bacterium]